jgi:hypothetical protein
MATWEFEHTPFAIIQQSNTKGVIIMSDILAKILGILILGLLSLIIKEAVTKRRLLNQLQAEISSNLKRLEEAIPDVDYAARLSRERKSWRVGISPKCTEYYTYAYHKRPTGVIKARDNQSFEFLLRPAWQSYGLQGKA